MMTLKFYVVSFVFFVATNGLYGQHCSQTSSYTIYETRQPLLQTQPDHNCTTYNNQATHYSYPAKVRVTTKQSTEKTVYKRTSPADAKASDSSIRIPAGSSARVWANFLGNQSGYVYLKIESVIHKCKIESWDDSKVLFSLPEMGLTQPSPATLSIALPNGQVVKQIDIILTKVPEVEVFSDRGLAVEITALRNELPRRAELGGIASGFAPPINAMQANASQ